MFPLTGTLLTGTEARKWMQIGCSQLDDEAFFCSGFLKTDALRSFARFLRSGSRVKILVRWRLDDILSKASDLDAYLFAKEQGWNFFMDMDFHGKVFFFPAKGIILGSANLTSAGFSLSEKHNLEVCTQVHDTPENRNFLGRLFKNSTQVTDM